MAQTIAIQRGTTTVSGSGTSTVTLFTQSGGTATRVIINQLIIYFSDYAQNSGTGANLYLTSSGGYSSIIGQLKYNSSSSIYAMQFITGAPNNGFNGTSPGTSNSNLSSNPFIFQNSTIGDMLASNFANTTTQYSNSSYEAYCNVPANFYMGPGDALKMRVRGQIPSGKGTASRTANIGYSFTTITES